MDQMDYITKEIHQKEYRRNHSWAITPISARRHRGYCREIGLLANCSVRILERIAREILSI